MKLRILESADAVNDVISTANYISAHTDLNTSDRFLEAIKGAYHQIAENPGIGTLRDYGQPDLQGMRMWRVSEFPRTLIFYLADEPDLLILRVLNGTMNINEIFGSPA